MTIFKTITEISSMTLYYSCTDMCDYCVIHQGDVQMTASVLIVLGEKLRPLVDETLQQLWLMSYIGEWLTP